MLTVPGLCWLCRMPLALSRWGICSVCTRSLQWRIGDLSTMWFTGHKSLFALWPVPEKIPAVERAGGGG